MIYEILGKILVSILLISLTIILCWFNVLISIWVLEKDGYKIVNWFGGIIGLIISLIYVWN